MGRSRYKIFDTDRPYFLTLTIVEWLPLFRNPEVVGLLRDSLQFIQRERGVTIYAYVVMENHLHLVASCLHLAKVMKEFKSYTARAIIDYLKANGSLSLLRQLRMAKLSHKTESDYQFWQEGSHPEGITSHGMMQRVIEYIHRNPVEAGYVDKPEEWRYSSARNYAGMEGLIEVEMSW